MHRRRRKQRLHRMQGWQVFACLLTVALSCESKVTAPSDASSEQTLGPVVHNAFGIPGPWWRADATPGAFDADLATCRSASSAARKRPGESDPLDAAYRAFLDCMDARGWQRGTPPPASAD